MGTKCEICMNCSKKFIGICKQTNMTAKQGILKQSNVKEQIWPTSVKYLRLSTFYGHYTHVYTVSKIIDVSTENKLCLTSK